MKKDLGDSSRATRDASASLPEPQVGLGHSVTPTIAEATHMYIGINDAGQVRAFCFDDPGYERQTRKITQGWLADGRTVRRVTIEQGRALFAKDAPK